MCVCLCVCVCAVFVPSVLQDNPLPPLTLTEEHVGVVTQATASDLGSPLIATETRYLQANNRPVMV